jgi:hypothetical protein
MSRVDGWVLEGCSAAVGQDRPRVDWAARRGPPGRLAVAVIASLTRSGAAQRFVNRCSATVLSVQSRSEWRSDGAIRTATEQRFPNPLLSGLDHLPRPP